MTAIEMTGMVDAQHRLQLDGDLPLTGPLPVKVIVVYSEVQDEDEHDEADWLRAAAHNPAFADLAEPEEDIYSALDGKPFRDQI